MARIEHSDSWDTSLSLEILKKKIKEIFLLNKIKIIFENHTGIRGKQGSQLQTRSVGAHLLNPKRFPKKILINFKETEEGFKIEMKMEESLGFGSVLGMKRKYMTYFKTLIGQFKKETQTVVLVETQNKLNYCIYCGSKIVAENQIFCGNCGTSLST